MRGVFSEGESTLVIFHPNSPFNTMKKIIVLCSVIVALGFIATGCGGDDKPVTPPTAPAATDAPPAADDHDHDDPNHVH